jgi:hypothetical protein
MIEKYSLHFVKIDAHNFFKSNNVNFKTKVWKHGGCKKEAIFNVGKGRS